MWVSQMVLLVKNLPGRVDVRDMVLIPGWGRSLGEGNDNPLQYSFLENPMDRGAWRATVHGATKSQTCLSMHAHVSLLKQKFIVPIFLWKSSLASYFPISLHPLK